MKSVPFVDTSLPKNLPLLLKSRAETVGSVCAQAAKDATGKFIYYTYAQLYEFVLEYAAALQELGVTKNSHVAMISDNRREWLISDLAILSLGGADVPRGCDSMGSEIRYIISYSECEIGIFENERQLKKVLEKVEEVPLLKKVILFDNPSEEVKQEAEKAGLTVYTFEMLSAKGKDLIAADKENLTKKIEDTMNSVESHDLATIIFTSGTTGVPKGVMLTHRNYLAQLEIIHNVLDVKQGDMWLSVLPVWHSFERFIQYVSLVFKSGIAYSKPVASVMLADFQTINPDWMCGVPRLWESLAQGIFRAMRKTGGIKLALFNFFVAVGKKYAKAKDYVFGRICQFKKRNRFLDMLVGIIPYIVLTPLWYLGDVLVFKKIKAKLGNKFHAGISGGGALQPEIDDFYRAIGVLLLEGYGITEAAPVLSVRSYLKPRPGCVGVVFPSAEVKIVAENHGEIVSRDPLPAGQKGLILAKGDQIMAGYYNRPDLTSLVIDEDGYLNTGDLGMLTLDNEIKITGRAKDTIVLLGGENIEPAGIESAITGSQYVEATVVLGQDEKYLAALIVPSKEMITSFADENGITYVSYENLLETPEIQNLIQSEIDSRVNAEHGFRTCERIFKFALLPNSFTVGVELSAKQEFMRHKINEKYKAEIESLFE